MTHPITAALEVVWGRALNSREKDWAQPDGGLGGLTEAEYLAYQARTYEQADTAIREHFARSIEAWRAANDFARSPDFHQALDAVLEIIRGEP